MQCWCVIAAIFAFADLFQLLLLSEYQPYIYSSPDASYYLVQINRIIIVPTSEKYYRKKKFSAAYARSIHPLFYRN